MKKIWDIYPVDHLPLNDNAAMAVWLGGGDGNMSNEIQKKIYNSVDKGYKDKNEKKRIESGEATDYICESLCNKVKLLPKKSINSYIDDWTHGDFILHVVNSNDNKRNSIIISSNPQEIINSIIAS